MTAHSSQQNAERLLQLSNEVSRIAGTLARLSADPSASALPPDAESDDVSPKKVMEVIRGRRLRARYFPEDLFADPAWDMMLDLLHSELTHRRVTVSSLCISAAVPATTALRWIKAMVEKNLFIRRADPLDGRRVFIELAPDTSSALRRYFAELAGSATI
jgi:hypothetical protein